MKNCMKRKTKGRNQGEMSKEATVESIGFSIQDFIALKIAS